LHGQTVVSEVARAQVAAGIAASELYLSLAAVPSAMAGLVPRALILAKANLQAHRCTLRAGLSADLEEAVSAGVLDVAVVTDYPPGLTRNRHLERTILAKDEMCVVLPPTHVLAAPDRGRLGLDELSEEISAEDDAGSAEVLVQAAATAGLNARHRARGR
jgi:DNA-binding transcriptional LysR family regulator